MSNLVGLGEACWIEQIECNRHECHITPRSLLAEVVAIDSAAVHLLPFDRLDGIGVGARVVVARDQTRIEPGEGWLGRVLDAFGRPLDGGPPCRAEHAPTGSKRRRSRPIAGALWGRG